MGSALLNTIEDPVVAEVAGESATGGSRPDAADAGPARPASTEALRQEVAERLAEHRRRRAGAQSQTRLQLSPEAPRPATTRAARIAATVAERYAHSQSYRAFLAAEADRAIQQAHAAAEVAALNAQAVAAAQQRLLEAFDEAAIDHAISEDASNGNLPREVEDAGHAETESQENGGAELNLWPDLEPARTLQPKAHHRSRPQPTGQARTSDLAPPSNLEPRTLNPRRRTSNPTPDSRCGYTKTLPAPRRSISEHRAAPPTPAAPTITKSATRLKPGRSMKRSRSVVRRFSRSQRGLQWRCPPT